LPFHFYLFVCILPGKAVPEMTYTVSGGDVLNPTHSLKGHKVMTASDWVGLPVYTSGISLLTWERNWLLCSAEFL